MKKKKLTNGLILGICTVMLCTTACSKSEDTNAENLKKEIYNPIYMGAKQDLQGNKIEVGKGLKGQMANQDLIDYYAQYETPKVYQVSEQVYVANGYGTANSIMIEGDEGLIIVNTNDNVETAAKEYEAFKKISDKPITDIIYTNYQHSYGAQAYTLGENSANIEIIAHEAHGTMIDQMISENSPIANQRKAIANGQVIGNNGSDGSVGADLGVQDNTVEGTMGYETPTKLLSGTQVTEMNINGINMQFIPAVSDSRDNFIVWLPDEKVCINDLALSVFPELYNLGGGVYRDPKVWIKGLNEIIELNPKYLVGTFGLPLTEQDDIKNELVLYRDSLQYLYSQTVRYMNKNYSVDQIVQSVKLTDKLLSGKLTGQFFGEIDYQIRAIYNGLIGWFGNDTVELHPVTDEFEAKKIVEGYGGVDKILKEGEKALEEKRYSWAVQLASYILENEPENEPAIKIKVDALRSMAQVTTASDTRNYYLTEVAKLEGNLEDQVTSGIIKGELMLSSKDSFLKILRVSIDPEKCGDDEFDVNFNFTDEDIKYRFKVRNGIGIITENPQSAALEINMTYDVFCDIAVGSKKIDDCIQSGEVVISGDIEKFQEFRNIFDITL